MIALPISSGFISKENYGNPSLIRPPRVYRRKEYAETASKAYQERIARPVRRPCSFGSHFGVPVSSVASSPQEQSSPVSAQAVPIHELLSNFFKEHIGSRVCISREKKGRLRYVGLVHDRDGIFCGVELDEPVGHHDGCIAGHRYFQTAPCHALFAPVNCVEVMVEKEGGPEASAPAVGEQLSEAHTSLSGPMLESCELIEDVQPLLISSYYFEECPPDQPALSVIANASYTIKDDSAEDMGMETPTVPSVDPLAHGCGNDEKVGIANGKDEANASLGSAASKLVLSTIDTNLPSSAAGDDTVGQCDMTVFGSPASGAQVSGHGGSRHSVAGKAVGTPTGSDCMSSPCDSLERAQSGAKSEKRKPERREASMATNSKSAKMDAPSSRNGYLKPRNGTLNGQALPQSAPSRPTAKPSKHAEIMAKLRESIKLDKDRPKREVKSRIGLPNPKTSDGANARTAEKENRYSSRASSSQANRSTAKKNAHMSSSSSPIEHEVANGKQPANAMPKGGGSSRSRVAEEKLSALRRQGETLKQRNSELSKGLVAFSIVIDYLNEQVVSSLRRQSAHWREMLEQRSSALASSNAQVEQLTKDKEELLCQQQVCVRRLQDECSVRLKDLEAKKQLEMDEALKAHEEEIRKLRESLEAEIEKRSVKVKYHRYQPEGYRQPERRLVHEVEEAKLASSERFANNVKEIESLRAVLEMKTEQNRQLQSKLKDLEKEVEETDKMKARIALLEQKNDELKEALELKKMAEKRLAVRHGDLLKTCEREKENSKRLKMDKEQLQFQLQQMLMSQSAYETPIHRQCTTSMESSAAEEGKMSQSLIQIYADCSPRHTRDRQVTVYTHEGVQKATIPEGERLADDWERKGDCHRSRNLSGGPEVLPSKRHVSAGRPRRRVRSSCEVETALRSSLRLCESLTGSLSCQVSEATDTDECHSLGDQENGSPGGIFVASYHSDSNEGSSKVEATADFPDKDDKLFYRS
uniref:CAP-Gly domain-containing protein n=1 Tax=Trichuris muris TaxID=70415 RepID=A0A5S6QSW2_TRIMR